MYIEYRCLVDPALKKEPRIDALGVDEGLAKVICIPMDGNFLIIMMRGEIQVNTAEAVELTVNG